MPRMYAVAVHGLNDPAMPGHFPRGPWVLVVGMHRSGTSAVTGAVGALGMSLPRPDDRIGPSPSNLEHWESHSIMLLNDDVLDRLGGSWDAPPDLQPGWEDGPQLVDVPDPSPVVSSAYPDPGPLVWKDPRVCLLLPYWLPLIPEPVATVFVWRSPVAVARSLQNRDGFSLVHGLSLWERYNREALDGLRGTDVFALSYEALMNDHRSVVASVAEWLGSLEQFAPYADAWDVDRAASLVSVELSHQSIDTAGKKMLLPEHRSLTKLLSGLDGGHRRLDPGTLPDESAWTKDVLANQREARLAVRRQSEAWEHVAERAHRVSLLEVELTTVTDALASTQSSLESTQSSLESTQSSLEWTEERLDSTRGELERITRVLTNMQTSTSWRVTKPLRSLSAKARPGPSRPGGGTAT
jgi:hypothetical protein